MQDVFKGVAMPFVRGWEGGWSNDKLDPGGLTKWGVTIRTIIAKALDFNRDGKVSEQDLRDMTEEQAEALYKSDYWDVTRCGDLPAPIGVIVFDCNVNQGPGRGARFLQAAVGAAQDGDVGDKTVAATWAKYEADPAALIREFQVKRALHYSALSTFTRFGLGWFRRLFAGTILAGQMAASAPAPAATVTVKLDTTDLCEFLADVAANAEAAARMAREAAAVCDDCAADLRDRALDLAALENQPGAAE